MYGGNHSPMLHQQDEAQRQQQQQQQPHQQQYQHIKQQNQGHGLTPWQPPASICPPSPFDTLLRPAGPQDGAQLSIASPFDFPSIPNSGSTFMSGMSGGAQSSTSLSNRMPPSPFDRPGASIGAGRVQQLLQNSQFGGHSLGRPPQLPVDRAARSPFDVALGQTHRSLQTTSSGSMQHNMLRMGGGLPLGEGFRSLERSLGSECSPATSYGTHEGGDDLDGVTQANVERQQQMYVRYSGMSEAVPCTEWSARESLAAEAGAMNDIDLRQRAEDMPLGVSLRIMSAPASFALPMVQRKPFKPAFQVRMEVSYRKHLYLPAAMEVHPVNDQAHGKMEQWAPDSEKMQAELEGNRMSKNLSATPMSCANGIGLDVASTPHENLHLEDFRFTDLKWAKSSRMSKRWLVFFVRIKNDILYLLYKLPTVVISRRTDQYSKAHEILTGVAASAAKRPRTAPMLPAAAASVPPPGMLQHHNSMGNADGPKLVHASTAPEGAFRDAGGQPLVVDGAYIRQWIHMRYKACNFKRYMSESDMSALLHEAGVYPGAPGSSADAFPVDPVKWEYFKNWFLKALNVLLHVGKMWEATEPHAICGFAVTRETAEALLVVQPTGTFLVRLSSQPGALAISCCVEQCPGSQAFVDHLLVDHVDLVNRDLPSWVHAHIYATHLLDFLGEKRHPKEMIFGPITSKGQQAGSPRGAPDPPAESPRQAQPPSPQLGTGQASSPPNMPSPLPLRSPGSSSPSNMPLDHLLMLANMTNSQSDEWNASPRMHNQMPSPTMQGSGFNHYPSFHDGQQLPDIPERELSLDVLTMDQLGTQRLESLGALGSFGQQNLGSLGKLGSNMGSRSKLCLSDSLGRGEPLGQRLESLNGQGLSSDSLDGISRQLLGSLGNLPENDPVLRDMLASMASAPPTLGDIPEGRGLANMDMSHGPWGSLGDMTSLSNRGGSLLTDLDPARMASARGSLGPLGGSSFTFNNPMGDTEMADAAHMTPNFNDNRFLKSPGQQQQQQQFQQQQQQQQQFAFQDNYWDPLVSEDPQSFKYGPPFGHGFNNNGGQG